MKKIRIKEAHGYGVTQTNMDKMSHSPKKIWDGNAISDVQNIDKEIENLAYAMQAMAGMAAEEIVFGEFTPAKNDLCALNHTLEQHGLSVLDPNDPDLGKKLFNTSPYCEGFLYAKQLLEQNRPKFDAVNTWLKKTDTLQGDEVEALIAGKKIREPE